MLVEVDGVKEERQIDYSVRRGLDEYVDYPVLREFEHIYESKKGLCIFSSSVK